MSQSITKRIKRNILLNPGPATTSESVKAALIVSDICPREKEFGDLVKDIRGNCLKVVNANIESHLCVLMGGSGTAAVEAAFLSLSNCIEGKILILDNGAYGKRIKEIAAVYNIAVDSLDYAWGDPLSLSDLDSKLADTTIKAVAWIHHETTTGILNPFDDVVKIAKKHGVLTLCDAMSSYGCLQIDLTTAPVDYLISSSNKGVHGMAGVGIVIASKSALEKAAKKATKSYYLDLARHAKQFESDGQFPFTPPVQVLYALDQALKETLSETVVARQKHYQELHQHLVHGMSELGFECLVGKEHHSAVLTAFIEPSNFDFTKYHDHLYSKGITVYPGKGAKEATFRIANMGNITLKDLDLLLLETAQFLKK